MRTITHVVEAGETIAGLAARYGVSPEALRVANHLLAGELHPGQPVVIPTVPTELTVDSFPASGWVPPRAWFRPEEAAALSGEAPEEPCERARSPVADRLWRIRAPFGAASLALVDHLLLALTASPERPGAGSPVTVRLLVINIGGSPLVLRYPTTQRAELVVLQENHEVFRASRGRLYAQMVQEVTLRPGQSELSVERFVPESSGAYRIVAANQALRPAQLSLELRVV
ncbi:MAG: BsuPI-related putative proteinase inhibitor [Chitinophagales bacterium]